jgi:hypothetical protein
LRKILGVKLSTNINTLKMKKTILLSIMALIVFTISSLAQPDKVLSQDNEKNAKTGKLSIIDQDTSSKKNLIKQYSFNTIYQNSLNPVIMINGKVSGYRLSGLNPNNSQYNSAFKAEKATSINGDMNGSGVIIVTAKRRANEIKVQDDPLKK